jgi:anthranilate phosphoribosyltransferase
LQTSWKEVTQTIREAIAKLVEQRTLTDIEAEGCMQEIMEGKASGEQIAAFLTALRMKGEKVEEIVALVRVMRNHCRQIHPKVADNLVDLVGTGGDKIKTFNVSTTSAFVVAGAGIPVAKHGNRSVTSSCGSADVLEALGLKLDTQPDTVERAIENVGIGFMFAPQFHPAMKHAARPRREIGIRTVFNILGPLTNPANASTQLLGAYQNSLTDLLANVLLHLGTKQAMVVHGLDGLDEISTIGKTQICWLRNGEVHSHMIEPEDFGIKRTTPESLGGSTPQENATTTCRILTDRCLRNDPRRNIVLLNAAAGIVVSGKADSLHEGLELAAQSIESGAAYDKLVSLVRFTDGDPSKLEELNVIA